MRVRARLVISLIVLSLALTAIASEDAVWLRKAIRLPEDGTTTWTIVVTTGHFGGDPQLAEATKEKIVTLLEEIGAKGDRVRIHSAEMSLWGRSNDVPIDELANELPSSQAPKSKGGRDIERILQEIARNTRGPILVFSPGGSILPIDGSGSLLGGTGTVEGFTGPLKRTIRLQSGPRVRSILLTVLTKNGLFTGMERRFPLEAKERLETSQNKRFEPKQTPTKSSAKDLGWISWSAVAFLIGTGAGFFFTTRRTQKVAKTEKPSDNPDIVNDQEITIWKEHAKALQRRLDFVSQEIEESVRKMSESSEVQLVELRLELTRRQKALESWDEVVIDFLDGVQRALDHPRTNIEAAGVWSRARSQFLQLTKRLGLDEILPGAGDPLISTMHRIEAVVSPTSEFRSGHVTRLIEPGYRRGDFVIRQAKVEIASEIQ